MVAEIKKTKLIIILSILVIFGIALLFRSWQLSRYPVSLSIDEVNIGYNAYSILKTGQDEWGEKLPLVFKSIGDYKPPVNVYLTVPSIALFGLNEFAVRFPVALIGSLSALVLIFILRQLKFSWFASLFGGFWLAVLPWHVNFSRASFEAITALFFLLIGFWFYLLWLQRQRGWLLILTVASFSLSVWTYHAERIFVPFLFLFLMINTQRRVIFNKHNFRQILLALIILAIFIVPFARLTFFTPAIKTRAAATSILKESSLIQALHHSSYVNIQEAVFDNDFYLIFRHWSGKYLNYFDLRFWFWKGMSFTPPGYPDLGLLYLIDLPLFLLGVVFLLKQKNQFLKKIALFWFFTGPLAASFTMNEQHPLRALVWVPFFGFVMAGGAEWVRERVKNFLKIILVMGIYFVFLLLNVFYFADIYLNQSPKFYSEYWQYGYKEIAQYACAHKDQYDRIIISETFGSEGPLISGTPYAYVLFYCQYDPARFVNDGRKVEKFIFRRADWKHDSKYKKSLLIAGPWDFLSDQIPEKNIIKRIYFLNNKPGFLFVET